MTLTTLTGTLTSPDGTAYEAALTLTPVTSPPPAAVALSGACIAADPAGSLTTAPAWTTATGITRPFRLHHFRRRDYSPGPLLALAAGGYPDALIDFEPDPGGGDVTAFTQLCAALKTGGMNPDFTFWHGNPAKKGFTSLTGLQQAYEYYYPAARAHGFRVVFDLTAYTITHDDALAKWYPGDGACDAIGVEYYAADYLQGTRLGTAAGFADQHGKPFGLTECGVLAGTDTDAQGSEFLTYVRGFSAARYADKSIPAHYDILFWCAPTTGAGYDITRWPAAWKTIMHGIWEDMSA